MKNEMIKTQPIMEKTFPNLMNCPINALTPSVIVNKNGDYIVSLLIIADKGFLKAFRNNQNTDKRVELSISAIEQGVGQDKILAIKVSFVDIKDIPCFKVELPQIDEIIPQLINGLKKINEVYLWIANSKGKVEDVFGISWDYDERKSVLEQFE